MNDISHGTDCSVIIPTYNRRDLLVAAIASVQASTAPVREIIVVDDGSTDDTRSVVTGLAADDARIQLVTQANQGANVARNSGADQAHGAWLAFLDSDDRWEPDKLRRQFQALGEMPGAVASFTGIVAVDGARELYRYDTPATVSLHDIRLHNVLGSTSTVVVRKSAFEQAGGFDPSLPSCQDWDLWLRLRKLGDFAIVQDPLLLYNDGQHGRITGNSRLAALGHQIIFDRIQQEDMSLRQRLEVRASHLAIVARLHQRSGDRIKALKGFGRAFSLYPSLHNAVSLARSLRNAIGQQAGSGRGDSAADASAR